MRTLDRRVSDVKLASGEALPVLLLLEVELEPALTLRADGYRFGELEGVRLLLLDIGFARDTERPEG